MSALDESPRLYKTGEPSLDLQQMQDYLLNAEPDYDYEAKDKYLVFFYIGTEEYQSTVLAYSHDHALELWCAQNKQGEHPEAVRMDESERNY